MRFASCERVSGEKRYSSAASGKTGLRWSQASWGTQLRASKPDQQSASERSRLFNNHPQRVYRR
jgi:hypothetical protein